MKYIVYLTTNIVNNKIYVGVHRTENPDKFDGYLGNGVNRNNPSSIKNPSCPFHYAVKKYGFDSFKRSIIQVFDTVQEALTLEGIIVDEEFIKRTDTYNITLGGGLSPLLNKVIYQYDLNGNFIKEWNSIAEATESFNGKRVSGNIGRAVINKTTSYNFLWSDSKYDKLDITQFNIYNPKIPVHIYDINCNYVQSFQSMSECCKHLDCPLEHIQRAIVMNTLVKGFYISKELYNIFKPIKLPRLSGDVHQYNLDGTYIKSYKSIKEVEKEFGEKMQGINTSIKMGEQYKGFLWARGEKLEFVKPYKTPKCSAKKIGQYTMEGELVKIFNTVREARKEFPNVSKVLNGQAKHCHNFTFKYIS